MRKIPGVWQRNHDGDNLIRDEVTPGCEWVLLGEGTPTRKWDGTACMVRGGILFKRYDRKRDRTTGEYKAAPDGWEACQEPDPVTGHWPGWVPVGSGPDDQWHRTALDALALGLNDGTYELCGPKINGNPEGYTEHVFIPHGEPGSVLDVPPSHLGAMAFLERNAIEGIVWHHPDGRMAKVKAKDFGLKWPRPAA